LSGKAGYIQQSGRVGRRLQDCASILILDPSRHQSDAAYVDGLGVTQISRIPENTAIVGLHLQCAATEIHVDIKREPALFRCDIEDGQSTLVYDELHKVYCTHPRFCNTPASTFGIRGALSVEGEEAYLVVDSDTLNVIDEVGACWL
jgi:hypothetical protein